MNAEQLSMLFTADVATSIATPEMYDAPLFEEEYPAIDRARLIRRREFAAGRAAARSALQKLGVISGPIPSTASRLPKWPNGYVGSISHCFGFCCAVVASLGQARSLGIDVEDVAPLPRDIYELVFDDQELICLEKMQSLTKHDLYKIGFSAKEAFYKCYYPTVEHFLDFRDVSLHLDLDSDYISGRFSANIKDKFNIYPNIDRQIIGRWCIEGGYIFAGATFQSSVHE